MEPAGERREQAIMVNAAQAQEIAPQWSPPVNGRSTRGLTGANFTFMWPQWSPPVKRGSILWAPGLGNLRASCRNGARRRTAGALQQVRLALLGWLAAMEPAGERREHPRDVTVVNQGTVPQWSPRFSGGSSLGPPVSAP